MKALVLLVSYCILSNAVLSCETALSLIENRMNIQVYKADMHIILEQMYTGFSFSATRFGHDESSLILIYGDYGSNLYFKSTSNDIISFGTCDESTVPTNQLVTLHLTNVPIKSIVANICSQSGCMSSIEDNVILLSQSLRNENIILEDFSSNTVDRLRRIIFPSFDAEELLIEDFALLMSDNIRAYDVELGNIIQVYASVSTNEIETITLYARRASAFSLIKSLSQFTPLQCVIGKERVVFKMD